MARNENNHALSAEIDDTQVRMLQRRIDKNSEILNKIVDKLVSQYCSQLDDYVRLIKTALQDERNPPSDYELDQWVMEIPVLLYFAGEGQEALGIKEDVAKAVRMELYNETRMDSKGTVADKDSAAEIATQNEFLTHVAYQRAYKKIKLRMELGNELLQSIKKVISRRMSEYELGRVDPQRVAGKR